VNTTSIVCDTISVIALLGATTAFVEIVVEIGIEVDGNLLAAPDRVDELAGSGTEVDDGLGRSMKRWKYDSQKTFHMPRLNASSRAVKRPL
jgi:hypothetical protein